MNINITISIIIKCALIIAYDNNQKHYIDFKENKSIKPEGNFKQNLGVILKILIRKSFNRLLDKIKVNTFPETILTQKKCKKNTHGFAYKLNSERQAPESTVHSRLEIVIDNGKNRSPVLIASIFVQNLCALISAAIKLRLTTYYNFSNRIKGIENKRMYFYPIVITNNN